MDSLLEAASAALQVDAAEQDVAEQIDDAQQVTNGRYRFESAFDVCTGGIKWHVDGCSYFWAVAEAIQQAQESIMILDWWLSPEVYLRRPPALNEQYRLDVMLKAAAERGVVINIIVYKEVDAALTLNSKHTKSVLEGLHPNIKVFRHPDHTPSSEDFRAELRERLGHVTNLDLAKASEDVVSSLYGTAKDVVLFWAHHEKLLVVDQRLAFMGGLDLCFGRWDTSSHPIADAHPGNLEATLFPGQDYNNARVFDFADVQEWNQNRLDRTKISRMGWSDVALSLSGPVVRNLVSHFVDRWNYIHDDKYADHDDNKYARLEDNDSCLNEEIEGVEDVLSQVQLVRSCSEWSSGHETERSIFNAYVEVIRSAKSFVYIENQFFITATGEGQRPVTNLIGAAIVERICRAHQNGEAFKVMVVMPAVPAFAGDLRSDDALGTRAILEFQYFSICRGGHSILEKLGEAGIEDPSQYIAFYNLRSFDRINTSNTMQVVEEAGGVSYEDASLQQDAYIGASFQSGEAAESEGDSALVEQYQTQADHVTDNVLDTVSSCYMDNASNLTEMQWEGDPEDEIDAYVSEELYIHSKLLIADDRIVICGSANLNDRSQLGDHDSEIAIVVEDPTAVDSTMNGEHHVASRFAASLRRFISRKHLGLLPGQKCNRPDANWLPIDQGANEYDWGSPSDLLVADPLHADFQDLWKSTAKLNTEIFSKAFHTVPSNQVRTWHDYNEFYAKYFRLPNGEVPKMQGDGERADVVDSVDDAKNGDEDEMRYIYGHVVRHEFPGGIAEVKQWLTQIRGNLVEMPLEFLADVQDIAKDGLTLNGLTDKLYT